MATDKAFIETVLLKTRPLDVTAKPMFGEYGLYLEGKMIAVVCDNTLFVKITEAGAKVAGRVTQGSPYDGAKPAFRVSSSKLNDRAWIIALLQATSAALPAPKAKKKR